MEDQLQFLDRVAAAALDLAISYGPKLLLAALILAAGYFIGRSAGRAMGRALGKFRLEPPVRSLLERATHLLVLGLFAIMALQNLGVELLPLVAGLGVIGAGLALATQGVLGNIVAGLSIVFSRPFRVGDYISIVKEEGEVLEISLFSTTLGHADLSRVVIPNRKIVGEILHNYGGIRQLGIEVGVSYDSDVNAVVAAIEDVLRASPRVLQDPAPVVKVTRLGESSIAVGVAPWVHASDFGTAVGEVNQAILEALRRRNIGIAAPQREIRVLTSTAYLSGRPGERLTARDAA